MTQPDDTELAATIERLQREHEHLDISAEVLIERRVFVAKGRDGVIPGWFSPQTSRALNGPSRPPSEGPDPCRR